MKNLYGIIDSDFVLDERIKSSSYYLLDWPLSRVLLKNNSLFPWLILVPRCLNAIEITDLSKQDRMQLMDEVYSASLVMQDLYKPAKMNTGALGNIVSQLHIHVVARFKDDTLWPHGIWQANVAEQVYADVRDVIDPLLAGLSKIF